MCWEARDAYYKCLDKAEIIDPIKDADLASRHCSKEDKAFEQNCAQSWVRPSRLFGYKAPDCFMINV